MRVPVVYIDESDEELLETAIRERQQVYEALEDRARQRRLIQQREAREAKRRANRAARDGQATSCEGRTTATAIVLESSQSDAENANAATGRVEGDANTSTSEHTTTVVATGRAQGETKTSSPSRTDDPNPSSRPGEDHTDKNAMDGGSHGEKTDDNCTLGHPRPAKLSLRRMLGMYGEKCSDSAGRFFWCHVPEMAADPKSRRRRPTIKTASDPVAIQRFALTPAEWPPA